MMHFMMFLSIVKTGKILFWYEQLFKKCLISFSFWNDNYELSKPDETNDYTVQSTEKQH